MRRWLAVTVALLGCADEAPLAGIDASTLLDVATSEPADSEVDARPAPPLPGDDPGLLCPPILIPEESPVAPELVVCVPGLTQRCMCDHGPGAQSCDGYGQWGQCLCDDLPVVQGVDAGTALHGWPTELPPRLIAPLSGRRTTTQRPTLRWSLPSGVTRARVELCEDRACARTLASSEVRDDHWRPDALRSGVVFWRVRGLRDDDTVAWTSATWEFQIPHGDTPVDSVGRAIKDFNGDGYDDALIGIVPSSRVGVGVLLGAYGGPRPTPQLIQLPSSLGWYAVGDLNGDGLADLVTLVGPGDFGWAPPPEGVHWSGSARIFIGSPRCTLSLVGRVFQPAFRSTWEFSAGLSIGDFDGDGFGDRGASFTGGIALYRGGSMPLSSVPRSLVWIRDEFPALSEGPALQMAGDLNGDGYEDIAAGNRGVSDGDGLVRVFYGNPEGRLEARVETIISPHGGEFGRTLVGADLNGDGRSELVIGSYGHFHVYRWEAAGLREIDDEPMPSPDLAMPYPPEFCRPGDLDGDGLPELTVAGSYAYQWESRLSLTFFRYVPSMSSLGDLDGDGVDDLFTTHDVAAGPQTARSLLEYYRGGRFPLSSPVRSWLGFTVLEGVVSRCVIE